MEKTNKTHSGKRREFITGLAGASMGMLLPVLARAQSGKSNYPDKPVRLVVTVPPGGASDFLARTVSAKLSPFLGQTIIVENRAGANGTIASAYVAHSAPDGYTLMQAAISTHGIGPYFYPNLPYDPFKDFAPIGLMAEFPLIMAVNAKLPVKSVAELIQLAKSKPGTLNFASAGVGSLPHLAGELFDNLTGAKMVHIPYKGSGPAVTDLAGGAVQVMFDAVPSLLPQIQNGKLRPIAALSVKKNRTFPDLPTFPSLGYPDMVASLWYGLMAPAGTPKAIIDLLNADLNKALQNPDLQKQLQAQGAEILSGTPQDFADYIKKDYTRWGKVIKQAHIDVTQL